MERFLELVQRHWTTDDETTAGLLLRLLKVPKPAAAVLLPIVTNAVRMVRRAGAHQAEAEVFDSSATGPAPTLTVPEERARFLKVLFDSGLRQETFALADGTRVRWGDATEEQLTARREFLVKMRDGVSRTIERIDMAIELLRSARVACLNDLYPAPPPPTKSRRASREAGATA